MEIIIAVVLIFIAYNLYKLKEFLENSTNRKKDIESVNTVLYPVYTKDTIEYWQDEVHKQSRDNEYCRESLKRQEKLEIQRHHENSGTAKDFKPSSALIDLVEKLSDTLIGDEIATFNWKRAIEANISVLNGKSINEASEEYELKRATSQMAKQIEKKKEILENYKEHWLKHWDDILKKNEQN